MVAVPSASASSPASGPELRPRRLFALFFGLGAASLVTQSVLFRELLLLARGSELVFGVFFAVWLGWIGVGAALGQRLAPGLALPGRSLRRLIWAGAGTPIPAVLFLRLGQRLLEVPPGAMVSWPEASGLLVVALAPFSLVVGLTFPWGCRLLAARSSRGIGHLYMVEALGALLGGGLFALLLVGRVSHLPILAVCALGLVALAGWVPDHADSPSWPDPESEHAWKAPVASGIVALVLLPILLPVAAGVDAATRLAQLRAIAPADEVAAVLDTPYEQVAVTRLAEQYTVYGDGQVEATFPDDYETPAEAYALVAQKPDAERVLILGNAATGLAQALVRALDERARGPYVKIVVVVPDLRLVETLRPYLPDADRRLLDERVRVVVDDPRAFLQTTTEDFDLVYLDLPEPTTVYLNRFYTLELFQAARAALTDRGVLAYRLTSASAYAGRDTVELMMSVQTALSRVFPHFVVSAGDDSTTFASTAADVLTEDPEAIDARLMSFPGAVRFRQAIALDYAPERVKQLEALMALAPEVVANRDDRPTSYFFGTLLWDRFSGDRPAGTTWLRRGLDGTRAAGGGLFAVGLLLLCGLWAALGRWRATTRADVALTVLVAGATSMALNLVLLMSYQSACGALYERLALMSGLFMLGLSGGAGLVAAVAPRTARPLLLVTVILAGLAVLALSLIGLLPLLAAGAGAGRQLGYAGLFVLAGAMLGAVFPATARILLAPAGAATSGDPTARAGGLIDAMDHFGAMLGALGVGTLVLPALGTTTTLWLIAALCGGVAGVWLARGRRA